MLQPAHLLIQLCKRNQHLHLKKITKGQKQLVKYASCCKTAVNSQILKALLTTCHKKKQSSLELKLCGSTLIDWDEKSPSHKV